MTGLVKFVENENGVSYHGKITYTSGHDHLGRSIWSQFIAINETKTYYGKGIGGPVGEDGQDDLSVAAGYKFAKIVFNSKNCIRSKPLQCKEFDTRLKENSYIFQENTIDLFLQIIRIYSVNSDCGVQSFHTNVKNTPVPHTP